MKGHIIIAVIAFCVYSTELISCAPTVTLNSKSENNGKAHQFRKRSTETESVNNNNNSSNGQTTTLNFLRKFGYLDQLHSNSPETLYSEETISNAIRLMQRFGALPETGQLDNATLSLMTKPRCGVPDIDQLPSRSKRFVLKSKGWNKGELSYRFENWSSKLEKTKIAEDMTRAFNVWADYAHLRFINKSLDNSDDVDISIAFRRGNHGDRYAFDGPGGVLAHAFYPKNGDIHFDEDEDWYSPSSEETSESINHRRGISFLSVATHELGHSLGLGHSLIQESVMFPYYQARESENPRLDYDDIMALYHLYILRNNGDESPEQPLTTTRSYKTTTTSRSEQPFTSRATKVPDFDWPISTEKPTSEAPSFTTTIKNDKDISIPDLCKDGFDTIAFIRNEIFVFSGEYMWRFQKRGELAQGGYPVKTSRLFPHLKGVNKIDAAFERDSDNKIFFFSAKHYWTFDGTSDENLGPNPITDFGLPSSLEGIDTAFVWGKNHQTYFFRDNLYWKYNETANSIGEDYPKDISRWRGLPDRLTSAMKYKDDITYFFKDEHFWRFDDKNVQTDEGFPMKTSQIWFNC